MTGFRDIAGWVAALLLMVACGASSAQTTVKYVHTDALGSVVAMTDASGALVETTREYEPYGEQLVPAIKDGPGYTGHVQDAATGLTYMQQRYYDPEIGRFLSIDPVTASSETGGNFNRYKYASNNPYRFIDPDGRLDREHKVRERPDRRSITAKSSGAAATMTTTARRSSLASGTNGNSGQDDKGSALRGVRDGAKSAGLGAVRAVRQVGRATGVLGADEQRQFNSEGAIVDQALEVLANDPQARDALYQNLTDRLRNSDYQSGYTQGYMVGRLGVGYIFSPIGALAMIGDAMTSVENGVHEVDAIVERAIIRGDVDP